VACGDDGIASFDRIRYRRHDGGVFLYAFDLIELDGADLRRDPLAVRKALWVDSSSTDDSRLRGGTGCNDLLDTFVSMLAADDRCCCLSIAPSESIDKGMVGHLKHVDQVVHVIVDGAFHRVDLGCCGIRPIPREAPELPAIKPTQRSIGYER
jgi:hypothetical protein